MYSSSMVGEDLFLQSNRNGQSVKMLRAATVRVLRSIILQLTKVRGIP